MAISAGYTDSLFTKKDGSLWGMGYNLLGQLGVGKENSTNRPELIVAGDANDTNINTLALVLTEPPNYNLISATIVSDSRIRLSFVGHANTKYALDRTFNLSPADWRPVESPPFCLMDENLW